MEYNQITKKVIDFQKMSFENWYEAVAIAQDQAVSTMNMMLNQATWIPDDGRNAVQNWINVCKEERNRFKSYISKGFSVLESTVTEASKAAEKAAKKAAS